MPEIPHEGEHREGLAAPANVVEMLPLAGDANSTTSRFQPARDFLHVDWKEVTQIGRIILPQRLENGIAGRAASMGSKDWRKAKVLACGPECKQVEVGDFILVAPEGLIPVEFEDAKYWFAQESVILAVVS